MIYKFKCPICGQEHSFLLQALFQGMRNGISEFPYCCPITQETFLITVTIGFEILEDFSRNDLKKAEEDAELRDHQWNMEEEKEMNQDADSDSRTT